MKNYVRKNLFGELKGMFIKKRLLPVILLSLILLFAMSASATVFAVTACPDPIPFTQPNGTLILVYAFGDEFLAWTEDALGNLIVFDQDQGGYCFAAWTDDGPLSTGELIGPGLAAAMSRPGSPRHTIPQAVIDKAQSIREIETAAFAATADISAAASVPVGAPPVYTPVELMTRKMLIVHVTWEDRSNLTINSNGTGDLMPKLTGKQIYDLNFGLRSEVARSVNGYYQELLLSDSAVILPAQVIKPLDGYQGVIEVELPGQHTNPRNNSAGERDIMQNALIKACAEGHVDLSLFDANGDGNLATAELAIGFIIDGWESAIGSNSPSFWGVSMSSTPAAGLTNGVKVASIFGQGAYHRRTGNTNNDMLTCGIIAHEMGHSGYSFSDTYDYGTLTGSSTSAGHGYWSLQTQGSWARKTGENAGATPGYQDGYNLVRSGFVLPGKIEYGETAVIDNHLDIYLAQSPITTPEPAAPATHPYGTRYGGQFFLLQQRKFGAVDNYDQGAFGSISSTSNINNGGLLIFHVDMAVSLTRINDKPSHMRAGIEEAHGGVQNMQQRTSATGKNNGGLTDLWGVNNFHFYQNSDPTSATYSYSDGRAFVNTLEPAPDQINPSGVTLTSIKWDPSTLSTSVVRGLNHTINFPGVSDVTVQYYSAATSWVSLPDTYDDTCSFVPPEGLNITSIRAVKGGMSYTFNGLNVNIDPLVLDVPVKTIAVFGIAADCNLGIIQSNWIYASAPALVGVSNYYNVFDNGNPYTVRLSKPGFSSIDFPVLEDGSGGLYAYFNGFYQIIVPEGVTNVRMQSNNWIVNPAQAGDKIALIADYYTGIKDAKMSFVFAGSTYNVDFKLDGSDPFNGLFIVNFPGVEGVTLQYYKGGLWYSVDDVFDDFAVFIAPGATSVRAAKGGMSYQADGLAGVAYPYPINIPVLPITVTGVASACNLAIVQSNWVYNSAPATVGAPNSFNVFDNGKTYELRIGKDGYSNISMPGYFAGDNAYLDIFYNIEIPDGVTNIRIANTNWVDTTVWFYNWIGSDVITLMKNGGPATLRYDYEGTTYGPISFTLDGSNPFDGLI